MTKSSKENITCQKLHSIEIEQLKGVSKLDCLSFEPHYITAILGPNSCGKSTILHALASVYMPNDADVGDNYKLIDFFPINPDSRWNGSKFNVCISYRNGKDFIEKEINEYGKGEERASRWTKRYSRRPKREVYYLGIDKCVPMIEMEKKAKFSYTTSVLSDEESRVVLSLASHVLNKKYVSINRNTQPNGRVLMGVGIEGIQYSSLSMSAGEQKVFQILTTVLNAGKYAFILIDEIDILLHEAALKKLFIEINKIAKNKSIQIVCTTHRESIINLSDIVNIRHLFQKDGKTFALENSTPDAINRITGEKCSPVEIYVEDDLSDAIVRKLCSVKGASKYIRTIRFGAAINCFTILGAALLKDENIDNNIYILDGDIYRTNEERKKIIGSTVTGTSARDLARREKSLEYIRQYNLPEGMNPEEFIKSILDSINSDDDLDEEEKEIIEAANDILFTKDRHNYLNLIIDKLGADRSTGLRRIIDIFYKKRKDQWDDYVREVDGYLTPIFENISK